MAGSLEKNISGRGEYNNYYEKTISNGKSCDPQEIVSIDNKFKHYLNPLHFRCWLMKEFEFIPYNKRKKFIAPIVRFYEGILYQTFFTNGHGDSRISKLLKTPSNILSYAKNRFS